MFRTQEPVKNVPFQQPVNEQNLLRTGLIVLAVLCAVLIGTVGFIFNSPFAPLLVIGAIMGLGFAIYTLRHPIWAAYAALFVLMLPIGLLPLSIQSILNRSLAVFAILVWLYDTIRHQKKIVWSYSMFFMAGFLVWSFISLSWAKSVNLGASELQIYALRFMLFLLLIPNVIRDRRSLDILMTVLAVNGWLLILASVISLVTGGYTPGTRLKVLSVNENELGIILMVTLPGAIWLGMRAGKLVQIRILQSYLFILAAIGLVAISGSRGSAISLLIITAAFAVLKATRPFAKFALIILLLGVLATPFVFDTLVARFQVQPGDTAFGNREPLWQAAWMLFMDHPVLGTGIGNHYNEIIPYVRYFKIAKFYIQSGAISIHNPILTILVQTGLIGLFLYMGVLITAVGSFVYQFWLRRRLGEKSIQPYFPLIIAILAGYLETWIKGGGMESGVSYFLIIALLLLPSSLPLVNEQQNGQEIPN